MRLTVLVTVSLAIVCGSVTYGQQEPVFEGKTLSQWEVELWGEKPWPHQAVRALGQMGPEAIAPLIKLMRSHPGGDIRYLSQEALTQVGKPAVEPMKQVLEDGDTAAKIAAVLGLEKILGQDAIPVLKPLLSSPDKSVVARAAGALVRITGDGDTYLPPLIEALGSGDGGAQWLAAESLGWCGPKAAAAIPAMLAVLDKVPGGVRAVLVTALGRIGTREAKEALAVEKAAELGRGDKWARLSVAHSCGVDPDVSRPVLPALKEQLADRNEDVLVRGYCAWAIDRIAPEERPETPRTLYVDQSAPNASDENPGTRDEPWKTIQRAAEQACAGDTVIVGEGIYRELVQPFRGGDDADSMITYRAADGASVTIKGSDVWEADWQPQQVDGVTVYAAGWARLEWDWPEKWPSKREAPLDRCEQVFVDGALLKLVNGLDQVAKQPGTFCTDDAKGKLFVHLADNGAPADHMIERSMRQQVFAPAVRGLGFIRVQGLRMTHAANPESNGANWGVIGHRAALSTRAGHHWVIEDCEVSWAHAQGIDAGGEGWSEDLRKQPAVCEEAGYHQLRRNYVHHNGVAGIVGWSGGTNYLVLEDNITNYNCINGNFHAYESAGVKLHNANHCIIRRHRSHGNDAFGIWLDYKCHDNRITASTCTENRGAGIFMEVSRGPNLVDNNVVIGTRNDPHGNWADGLYSHDADQVTWANNLVLNNAGWGVRIRYLVGRSADWGPTTAHKNRVLNNIISGNGRGVMQFQPETDRGKGNLSDGNVLWGAGAPPRFGLDNGGINTPWEDTILGREFGITGTGSPELTFEQWAACGNDGGSILLPAEELIGQVSLEVPEDDLAPELHEMLGRLWSQDFGETDGYSEYQPGTAQGIVATLAGRLRDGDLLGQFMLTPTMCLQMWRLPDGDSLAAWDWSGAGALSAPGNAEPVALTGTPTFAPVRGLADALQVTRETPRQIASGGETTIALDGTAKLFAPADLNARLDGGEITLRPRLGIAAGTYRVIVASEDGIRVLPFSVVAPIRIDSVQATVGAAGAFVEAAVANRMAADAPCTIEMRLGDEVKTSAVNIQANAVGKATFALPDAAGFAQVAVKASLPNGGSDEAGALLSLTRSRQSEGVPIIDGRADDWEGVQRYRIDAFPAGFFPESLRQAVAEKPGDTSAQFATRWDNDALYLLVEVTDDVHLQVQETGLAWGQDSLQALFSTSGEAVEPTVLELDFDLPSEGSAQPRVYGRKAPGNDALPAEAMEGVRVAIARAGAMTTYEAAIPWACLGAGSAPQRLPEIRFALVVNDDDGDGRGRHGLQWFFGIHEHRGDYSRLGRLWMD